MIEIRQELEHVLKAARLGRLCEKSFRKRILQIAGRIVREGTSTHKTGFKMKKQINRLV